LLPDWIRPKLRLDGPVSEEVLAPLAAPAAAPSTYSASAPVALVRVNTTWCQEPSL
jgi:hypothetical protein